jgi:site-specific recombinase XerD
LRLPDNKVFPVKDCASMDMSLRHVARHAGLSFNPTMHTARHTFATTVTLSQGVPQETVSKMLGYKHITSRFMPRSPTTR